MPEMMRVVRKAEAAAGISVTEVHVPYCGPGEVLIAVKAASICGTDYHIYSWDRWAQGRVRPPITLGHEVAGEVAAVGAGVTSVKPGDYVSAESHIVCGICPRCRTGEGHLCEHTRIIGVDRDGGFAPYIVMPEVNCWLNDRDLPFPMQAIQEPLGNAVHTALAGPLTGKTVLIMGCGPIGLMAIPVAKMSGAEAVFAVDISPYRLELAGQLGADVVVNSQTTDPVAAVQSRTGGHGCDVVLEMSGNPAAIRQALHATRKGGRVSLLGLPTRAVELNLADDVIMRGLTLQGIAGRRMFQTWFQVRALMRAGLAERLAPLLTHEFPLDQAEAAMELIRTGSSGKIVLRP